MIFFALLFLCAAANASMDYHGGSLDWSMSIPALCFVVSLIVLIVKIFTKVI